MRVLNAAICLRFKSIALVLCWLTITPASGQVQSLQNLLTAGDARYEAFDNQSALRLYQQALSLDSTSFEARLKVSRTSYDYGLDLVAENDPETAFGIFEASILHAQKLVAFFPDSAQAHFMLAAMSGNLALFKSGREKILLGRLVEEHSKKAIALDSSLAYPYVSLGIYYRELSRLSWLERGLAKVFFGRIPDVSMDEALTLMEKGLKLRPEFPFLHFELAGTFLSLNQHAHAIQHLESLVRMAPETTQDARNQAYAHTLLEELRMGK